jgi:tRNA threonylcarbamoyladenosine biosynthesis protein TsaB
VAAGDELLAIRHVAAMHGQAEALLPMIDDVVREARLTASALDVVAVTIGPGSFTGIRVGLAAAGGIALAGGLPLIGISSFEAAAEAVPGHAFAGRRLLVALESRRADLYVQLFDRARRPLCEPAAIMPETLATAVAAAAAPERAIAVAGDAAIRGARALTPHLDAIVVEGVLSPVIGALHGALRRWRRGEGSGRVRPLYLRPPDVTVAGGERPPGAS